MNAKDIIIWSSDKSGSLSNPVAQLLDSGNLVVRDENNTNPGGYRWQSFDHPGDTLLPGMKLGWDLVKGIKRNLNSWKSADDPSPGKYTSSISLDGYPQLVLRSGSVLQYRHGSWDEMLRANQNSDDRDDVELPLFEFTAIAYATNDFSESNKLGQGGFGSVYKGILEDGKEIAVKRLSSYSKQGLREFKNEISCIVKLQHRNLVRLLGCCIKEGEMLLIYEYMPNKSLDSIIFDKERSKTLDWSKRYNIAKGIARGLLHLHEDSRLRIIHRDLKVSNILLDNVKNPKISDFGLARSFGGSEIEVNTTKVAGTHGYMSPEYLIDGIFSIKSDVYSFGVVVLEIVSGEKIRDFFHPDEELNLLGYAWKLYAEGNCLALVDRAIVDSCISPEVLRAIQIGLLCVQPYAKDRPTMSDVVAMLTSEAELPEPQQPGFFTKRQPYDSEAPADKRNFSSRNELTATFLAPR